MTASFRFSKWTIFGIFNELLSTQNVNVARFARNVEWDFFSDFQTPCKYQKLPRFLFLKSCDLYCGTKIYAFFILTKFFKILLSLWVPYSDLSARNPPVCLPQNKRKTGFSFLDLFKTMNIRNIFLTSVGNGDPCTSTFNSSNFSLMSSIKSADSWKRKLLYVLLL